jgi:hypothetical protein
MLGITSLARSTMVPDPVLPCILPIAPPLCHRLDHRPTSHYHPIHFQKFKQVWDMMDANLRTVAMFQASYEHVHS